MLHLLRKYFKRKDTGYYSIDVVPNFEEGHSFLIPNEGFKQELSKYIDSLDKNASLIVEKHLKEKQMYKYVSKEQLIDEVFNDVQENYSDYSKEFAGEEIKFEYYLAHSKFHSSSVEIIQRVFHESADIGDLYYSLVIKYYSGSYYYWKW
jgi:uncharacterized membrane protein YcgQ (UPF0703/DUF1980 family)